MQDYFKLTANEQKLLLQEAEDTLNYSSAALEKDIWICWLLEKLFQLPIQMAFKGGTSLSRIYNLIQRYSEDVDITIDYRNFREDLDLSNISRSQLKIISEQLKRQLVECINTTVLPYLRKSTTQLNLKQAAEITLSENGEQLRFYYPSAIDSETGYLRDHVLLEFGIRNSTEPCEQHSIAPLVKQYTDTIAFPSASVNVLSPIRTFWEKATLIHVECHRNRLTSAPERLSRHWYDLAKLANSTLCSRALEAKDIFLSVIEHKKAFYNASYANYDDCLNSKLRLIPSKESIEGLEKDYQQMISSGFFSETPPKFSEIIETLSKLEKDINTHITTK